MRTAGAHAEVDQSKYLGCHKQLEGLLQDILLHKKQYAMLHCISTLYRVVEQQDLPAYLVKGLQ
jgi:hypothetical protein